MPTIDVLNRSGEKVSQRELSDTVFDVAPKSSVLHEVVSAQLAGRRSGTAATKQRGEVSGSSRKLFRQKGTGRARRGNIKSPLLRGGGVTFGPQPRSYGYKPPKKLRRLALRMALTSKLRENQLVVLDSLGLEEIKTKAFLEVVRALNIENALIVTEKKDETLELSSRNVANFQVMRSEGLNVYDVLKHRFLVLLEPAVNQIEGRLSA